MSAEAERKTDTIPEWKQEEVADLVSLIETYESIGVVDVTGIPSRQLQAMRAELYGSAQLRMGRNTLVRRALDDVDKGVEALSEYVTGQVGLVGTNDNPFALFKELEASKTPAPINAGEVAPNDIVIPEGDTGMDPGPFVGDLQQVGAQAQIMEGSIKVTADSVVAEAGEEVSAELANVLAELGIEPKEVGLDLRAVFSDGVVFEADELAIDVEEYRGDVEAAAARAQNLAVNAAYPTKRTVPALLAKASGGATALGLAASVESPDLADDLVRRADVRVRSLAALIDDEEALPEELHEGAATDVGAPDDEASEAAEESAAAEADSEEPTDDQTEDADADDETDDDDDDDGGDALGAMFE